MSPAQVTRVRRYRSASQAKRWGSLGVSVFLHLGILFSIVFVAKQEPVKINLDAPIMTLTQVTIGAAGPKPTAPPPAETKPAPPAPPAPPPKPVEAEAVPVPKIEEVAKQAEPVTPPPVPEEKPVEPPKPAEPPKPVEPVKKGPTDEELLAAALAGAKTDAKPAPKVSGGQSALDEALSSAGKDAKAEKVITGESGDGYGIVGLYQDSIKTRVHQNFRTRPSADGKVNLVLIRIEIGVDGSLLNVKVQEPSGDDTLDAHVIRAVRETGRFEPPPKGQKVWDIPFTNDR